MDYNEIWKKYEKSHDYMQKKGIVSKTDRNWDMYIGYQWKGMNSNGRKLPILNIIKPVIKYKVSTIAQHAMTANFSDADSNPEYQSIYREMNRRFAQSWEKAKMDTNAWKCNKDAAIAGDSYAYFYTDDTNDQPQILSNTSVLLGDENQPDIQKQPYIIIRERLTVQQVKDIAKSYKIPQDEIDSIASDDDTSDQTFNKEEVSDKVTSLIYFTKKDGVVNVAKATKTCIYMPMHPLETMQMNKAVGHLTMYPIASFIWEPKPNSARGVSDVEFLIPNQIELNKTLARRSITVELTAYPRIAYDTTAIENPDDLSKVGAPIGMATGSSQSVSQAISYLNAANMSSDAQDLFNDLLTQTKELAGAGDSALGNVDPQRTAAQAIIAVRDQTQVPLNEQVNTYQQYVEDIALIWFDMWTTYDVDSFNTEQVDPITGEIIQNQATPEILAALKPSVRIDVSQDNNWTKLSEQQTLDNLLNSNQITLAEWADLIPDNSPVPKGRLQKILKQREEQQMQQAQQQIAQNQMQNEQEIPENNGENTQQNAETV